MRRFRPFPTLALLLGLLALGPPLRARAGDDPIPSSLPSDNEDVEVAIRRGVAYLVGAQKENGAWGSTAPTLYLDIYAPVPSSFPAFQVATTALAVTALVEAGGDLPGAEEARRRGADFLIEHHAVKRTSPDSVYNVWSHLYALEAFCRLYEREKDEERRRRLRKAAAEAMALMLKYESVDGGWGYYDDYQTKTPGHWTTSFTTAAGLVALKAAKDCSFPVPERLVTRGVKVLEMLRFPNNAFAYAIDHRLWPQGGINQVKGSLARTPACLLALDDFKQGSVELAHWRKALDDLEREGRFLRIARKYPFPHEAWYANSGYFCFFGYRYASEVIARLPEEERPARREQIRKKLLPLQEKDGSWWDYQFYGYHKPYGTAYVLMALSRCR